MSAVTFLDDWQRELAHCYTDPVALGQTLQLDAEWVEHHAKARQLFAMRVPRPFVALMEPGNPHDPLLQQVLPHQAEFTETPGFSADPLIEKDVMGPTGLLHKYKSRVLIVLRGGCAVNCRYCFRRHFPYQEHKVGQAELAHIETYIREHSELNEVILSGGDPMMAKDYHLADLFQRFAAIDHIKRVRIHSRFPVVLPQRLTPEFTHVMTQTRLQTVLVLHINHPQEIGAELRSRVALLKQQGVLVLNQSVLLKGINDTVPVLAQLSEDLFDAGILPYYIHQLDRVQGAAHFEVSEGQARLLMQGLLAELPGFLVPKWVREEGGKPSKTPLSVF